LHHFLTLWPIFSSEDGREGNEDAGDGYFSSEVVNGV